MNKQIAYCGLACCMCSENESCVGCRNDGCKTISLITGISAYSLIKAFADKINQKTGIVVHVYQIENSFFGDKVTVAGLITGKDIIQQLKDKKLGEQLLIPDVMLRKGENVFLDGMTLHELEEAVGVPVHVVPVDGKALVEAVTL
jgi:NifB/MoaA-like Fe-S oxidoreductase